MRYEMWLNYVGNGNKDMKVKIILRTTDELR